MTTGFKEKCTLRVQFFLIVEGACQKSGGGAGKISLIGKLLLAAKNTYAEAVKRSEKVILWKNESEKEHAEGQLETVKPEMKIKYLCLFLCQSVLCNCNENTVDKSVIIIKLVIILWRTYKVFHLDA